MIDLESKIYIAGHKGLVGSAILRRLKNIGYKNLIYIDKSKLDLLDQKKVFNFLKRKKPDFIFIAAAKVGGILANNNFKGDFIYQNLTIQNNLIHGAYLNKIKRRALALLLYALFSKILYFISTAFMLCT